MVFGLETAYSTWFVVGVTLMFLLISVALYCCTTFRVGWQGRRKGSDSTVGGWLGWWWCQWWFLSSVEKGIGGQHWEELNTDITENYALLGGKCNAQEHKRNIIFLFLNICVELVEYFCT